LAAKIESMISSVSPARSAAGTGFVNPAVLTSTCTAFTWLATSCAACARLAESVIDAFTAKWFPDGSDSRKAFASTSGFR
jgi:hypothetical protein